MNYLKNLKSKDKIVLSCVRRSKVLHKIQFTDNCAFLEIQVKIMVLATNSGIPV